MYNIKQIDDNKIRSLYEQGYLHKEIAKELGYGVSTVTNHLLKMGIHSVVPVDKKKMIALFEEGKTDKEIAQILGCTRSNVTTYLNRFGYSNRKSKADNIALRNQISKSLVGRFCGENNPNYKGTYDITTVARGIFKTFSKRKMREANYTCAMCGKHGGDLEPFHVIIEEFIANVFDGNKKTLYNQLMYYPDFVDEKNLVVLCRECHKKIHSSDNHEPSPFKWEGATTIEPAMA